MIPVKTIKHLHLCFAKLYADAPLSLSKAFCGFNNIAPLIQ
jgi:hypothetical protein